MFGTKWKHKIIYSLALLLFTSSVFSATLMWDANTEEDLAGYEVCIVDEDYCVDVGNVTEYILDWTPANSYLVVKAYDFNGNISDPSDDILHEGYDCVADFDDDGRVTADDVTTFLLDFGRCQYNNPCTFEEPCFGDFDGDGAVAATDVTVFLGEFPRWDCK